MFKFRLGTHDLNEELGIGIEGGKVRRNVPCVGMSVRMWVMCYGSVQYNYSSTRVLYEEASIVVRR